TNPGTGGGTNDQALGALYLGAPHRYRLDWHADGTIGYFIDGVNVANGGVVAGPMRPIAASDLGVGSGTVDIDWIRMTPYAPSGTFLSRVFDSETNAVWNAVEWTSTLPAGPSISIRLRAGNIAAPDTTWTAFTTVAPGSISLPGRYVHYEATLSSNDRAVTPSLDDIIISTSHAPVAADDPV